jgi:hypothetical protein
MENSIDKKSDEKITSCVIRAVAVIGVAQNSLGINLERFLV